MPAVRTFISKGSAHTGNPEQGPRRGWVTACLTLLATLTGALIPLLTATGKNLEYEYATLTAALLLILIPFVIIWQSPGSVGRSWPGEILVLFAIALGVSFLPGIIRFAAGFCFCSVRAYLFWMALQTLPALLLAFGVGGWLSRISSTGPKRKALATLLWGSFLLLAAIELLLVLWMMPQKRITHWLSGFIHGPIYDASIPVDAGIILRRCGHALLGALLMLLSGLKGGARRSIIPGSAGVLLWGMLNFSATFFPGGGYGSSHLKKFLTESIQGAGFVLYHAPDPASRERYLFLASQAQFHLSELKKIFAISPDALPAVEIFVYPGQNERKLWFGADTTDVTDVRSPSVHITLSGLLNSNLRHELVHAVSSSFSWHGLGFHPNIAVTEGLAVAFAPEFRSLGLHEGAASLLLKHGSGISDALFSPFFWTESGPRAYTIAGSLLSFVLARYGPEQLRRLYTGELSKKIFGKPFAAVMKDWQQFVLGQYNEKKHGLLAEALYRAPGMLFQTCPHTSALYRSSNQDLLTRIRRPSGWSSGKDYVPWLLSVRGPEKPILVSRFNTKAFRLFRSGSFKAGSDEPERLLEEISRIMSFPPQHTEDLELLLLKSDILAQFREKESLDILYALRDFSKKTYPGSQLIRQIWARISVSEEKDLDSRAWRAFLAGWIFPESISGRLEYMPLISHYLRFINRMKPYKAPTLGQINQLKIMATSSGLPSEVSEKWLKGLGNIAIARKDWLAARELFILCTKYSHPGRIEKYIEISRLSLFMNQQLQGGL